MLVVGGLARLQQEYRCCGNERVTVDVANANSSRLGTSLAHSDSVVVVVTRVSHAAVQLLSHRSVPKFSTRPLPEGTLELLVAAAQSAASSSNLQLWSVISVQDPDRRKRRASAANNQIHVRESALFLVWLADLNRATVLAQNLGLESKGLEY